MTENPNHYESVAYERFAYPQSHPDRLATVATLFGMQPRAIDAARVLEVGCASGGNLLPMAATFPKSEFVGVDLSPTQIAQGQAGVDALGLTNIRLHAMSLADIGDSFGQFDYIIAHGVYSWVSSEIREKLMALCARHLSPMGVAYISFNTLPGSSTRAAVREMIRFHTRSTPSLINQISKARALLTFLSAAMEQRDDAYAQMMLEELAPLGETGDFYIAHEYLEETNYPCYFSEFASHARAHGLQFLGESEIQAMSSADLNAKTRAGLRQAASSIVEAEQYLDFLRNRAFRQTLLCRQEVELNRAISPVLVEKFHFASPLLPVKIQGGRSSTGAMEFRGPDGGVVPVTDPIAKAVFQELGAVWPKSLPFSDLVSRASTPAGLPADGKAAATLGHWLLSHYATSRAIEFQLCPPVILTSASGHPMTTALARWQAAHGTRITNARHENVLLGPGERDLLSKLDGTRALASLMIDCPAAGHILALFAAAALLVG